MGRQLFRDTWSYLTAGVYGLILEIAQVVQQWKKLFAPVEWQQ